MFSSSLGFFELVHMIKKELLLLLAEKSNEHKMM